MDAYPEPAILPREEGDQEEAKMLSSILPLVLEQNHFEEVYCKQAWEKNKHGTGAYAVYWDRTKLNGLGDISICGIDLMNLFWEPGIEDIQKIEHLFLVSAQDREALRRQFGADREAAGLARAFSAAWKQLLGARQSLYSLLDIRADELWRIAAGLPRGGTYRAQPVRIIA